MEARALEQVLRRMEKRNVKFRWAAGILAALWIVTVASVRMLQSDASKVEASETSSVRVRNLVVTDEDGIDRVWLGAVLPNPLCFGRRYKRSEGISGASVTDADGNERAVYATDDTGDVFVSLASAGHEQASMRVAAGGGAQAALHGLKSALRFAVSATGPSIVGSEKNRIVWKRPEN